MIDEKKLIESLRSSLITGRETFPIDLIIECIEDQPKVGEWIPVSERLPEDARCVFVTITHTYESDYVKYDVARYIDCANGERHWCSDKHGYLEWDKYSDGRGGCSLYKVIAWMPLPEPYKDVD